MIADGLLLLLKTFAMICAALLVPVALLVATPFVLLFPTARDGDTWGKVVISRYCDVAKTALEFVALIAAL